MLPTEIMLHVAYGQVFWSPLVETVLSFPSSQIPSIVTSKLKLQQK